MGVSVHSWFEFSGNSAWFIHGYMRAINADVHRLGAWSCLVRHPSVVALVFTTSVLPR